MRSLIQLLSLSFIFCSEILWAQQHITGKEKVTPYTISNYSIEISPYDQVDWKLIPANGGVIVNELSSNIINVQWNELFAKDSAVYSLMAFVRIPNSENTLNYLKKIVIVKPVIDPFYVSAKKERLSKQSKDSLRFFSKVICDGTDHERSIELRDSSLQMLKPNDTGWKVRNLITKTLYKEKNSPLKINLLPGKYQITLYHLHSNRTDSLMDTLTLYPLPQPSFNLSNYSPCKGSLVTFTNTTQNPESTQYSTFYFGTGNSYKVLPSDKTAYMRYNDVIQSIVVPYLEVTDLHGCQIKSKEQAITVKANKFSNTNLSLEPITGTLRSKGDKLRLAVVMGKNTSPANPNGPFSYAWSNGKAGESIEVSQGGNYHVLVTDKLGCQSNLLNAKILQEFTEADKPIVKGPNSIKAGSKMEFSMKSCDGCLYQWKFISDGSAPATTSPVKSSTIIPAGWENAKPGNLSIIGIILKKVDGETKSIYSDTLRTLIY